MTRMVHKPEHVRLTDEQMDAIISVAKFADSGCDHFTVENGLVSISHDGERFTVPFHHAIKAFREYEMSHGLNLSNAQGWYSSRIKDQATA